MNYCKIGLTLFAFSCLLSEVRGQFNQYTLMRRGDVSKYDTSVNIHIDEYRLIRRKVLTADTLSRRITAERISHDILDQSLTDQARTLRSINARQAATIIKKDADLDAMAAVAQDCTASARKFRIAKAPWLDTMSKTLIGIGIGVVLKSLISN